jgi:transketolase
MALKRSQTRAGKKIGVSARPPAPKPPAKAAINGKTPAKKSAAQKVVASKAPAKQAAKTPTANNVIPKANKAVKLAPKVSPKKSTAKKTTSNKPRRKSLVQQALPFWSELLETNVESADQTAISIPETVNKPLPEPENTMSAATITPKKSITELAINTIRTLSIDGVQAANSGHPGTPMALAPIAYSIWQNEMRYDPTDPNWPARDRFVLSCGHASMLLYSMLHLAEVRDLEADGKPGDRLSVPLDDIKNFRQWHSKCPGHPEHFHTVGVETTTGPLGQGCGNSVGMALSSKWLAAKFNRPGFRLFDFNVYTVCSDGDLMEGVAAEAASLAGHLELDNLCWIYDDNKITIEGETDLAFSEDVGLRFEGLGWNVVKVDDANDIDALTAAYRNFQSCKGKPTLIIVRSIIGWGSPNKANTHGAHGAPLGPDEIKLTKQAYGWPDDQSFLVPDEVREHFRSGIGARGQRQHETWNNNWADYARKYPDAAAEWQQLNSGELPAGWDRDIPEFPADPKGLATRVSGGKVLNGVAKNLPWLVGGSADLAPSTMTLLNGESDFEHGNYGGRNMHFGIREHAMGAALNGMALCKLRPYGATFFVFYDYCKPSVRLSALGKLPALYIFTHDSIGVGEDGPTHQPIEHMAALRAVPDLIDMRPGDANEVSEAYRAIIAIKDRPTAMVLTRQNLPTLDRSKYASAKGTAQGAYILADAANGQPSVILIGTGSELSLCVEAYEKLTAEGIAARVVSMPSWYLFSQQSPEYQESVLPASVTNRVACEAAAKFGWERYLGFRGIFVGMYGYGASAPAPLLYKNFGITADAVYEAAKKLL